MPKDTLQPSQSKGVYRVKNWPEYNAGLIARGSVTIWMDEAIFWPAPGAPSRRGRPQAYSDAVIQLRLAMAALAVPNYSTLSRRAKSLRVQALLCWCTAPTSNSLARASGKCASTATASGAVGAKCIWRWTPRPGRCAPC